MLETYLGSIPNLDEAKAAATVQMREKDVGAHEVQLRQNIKPLGVKFVQKSVQENVLLKMVEPKGTTVLSHPFDLSTMVEKDSPKSVVQDELREILEMQLMVRMLETRLVEVLRFKRGQVYSVSVSADFCQCRCRPTFCFQTDFFPTF